ncbi:hypothetical protein D9619_005956 [Psilocybe cf. subviscida]|uniref:HAT C-terminal dimerisation domain-containing protein n=1 Tax=Psilocybe cf. subviscida TaxID=2480587 RepID=A0A8H5BX09_9AGAR|nr:hypothetical protein D9619_005956 [Psilocybe cf. subviscida]
MQEYPSQANLVAASHELVGMLGAGHYYFRRRKQIESPPPARAAKSTKRKRAPSVEPWKEGDVQGPRNRKKTTKAQDTMSTIKKHVPARKLPTTIKKSQPVTVVKTAASTKKVTSAAAGRPDAHQSQQKKADLAIEKLKKGWDAPIYAFFKPDPLLEYIGDEKRLSYTFVCNAPHCKNSTRHVRRYQDKKDAGSTGNMRKHAVRCWGKEVVDEADKAKDANAVRKLAKDVSGRLDPKTIMGSFKRSGKGKISYSYRQHTRTETRAEIVRWVAESLRPFEIVKDKGFKRLMKTGRPDYWIPSPSTVSRDVKTVFSKTRNRIAKLLQEHDGALSFATDAWTSPNHRAYVAVTVHFEHEGVPICMLLDFVEVPRSHSGANLAAAFAKILEDFGIEDKILSITCDNAANNMTMVKELEKTLPNFPGATNLTRCFTHTVNLVAKTAIRVFDVPKDKDADLDEAEKELLELAKNIELEDLETRADASALDTVDLDDEDEFTMVANSTEGWVDERATLSAVERADLDDSVRPLRLLLTKLRKFSYAVIHSSTLLRPMWLDLLAALKLAERIMPRDVTTRWNSTYDMLQFALKYRRAIVMLTADQTTGLRQYELTTEEWDAAKQLVDMLKIFKDGTLFFSRATPNLATVIPAMDLIDTNLATIAANDEEANMFDNMPSAAPAKSSEEEKDELALYLLEEIDPSVKDPLKWWRKRVHLYPHLSRMALDYLSIPDYKITHVPTSLE